ncbi:MAG: hypothetical protein A2173_02460 [Planctomycetes bacterium RBG_13_44_8b]|nr:MAG: hypothetical protein A2173_02460 [Planctomycetes bacterium RBG_13_44_8b]
MSKRISISKRIRFEVFKRDKFTCQYCGKKAPDVILEIDHMHPKSKGGSDEMLNLITSCRECNRGKKDIRLDDQSTLQKQRREIEERQERREQIELMFKWRESLRDSDRKKLNKVVKYIDKKIDKFQLNENGRRTIEKLINKFSLPDILDAIDISAKKYLKYDTSDDLTKDSVEDFIDKIGGILTVKSRSPIEQKLAYIKGICRNRFEYWDSKKGSMILNEYVNALKKYGWSEKQILDDLENELELETKESNSWSEWKCFVEGWIDDIKKWK